METLCLSLPIQEKEAVLNQVLELVSEFEQQNLMVGSAIRMPMETSICLFFLHHGPFQDKGSVAVQRLVGFFGERFLHQHARWQLLGATFLPQESQGGLV